MTEGTQALLARVLREAGRPVDVASLLASLRIPTPAAEPCPTAESLEARTTGPLPLGRFRVTYEYVEAVEGQSRRFLHQAVVEANGLEAARAAARAHFEQLERLSGVGWTRALVRCHVAEVGTGRAELSAGRFGGSPERGSLGRGFSERFGQ